MRIRILDILAVLILIQTTHASKGFILKLQKGFNILNDVLDFILLGPLMGKMDWSGTPEEFVFDPDTMDEEEFNNCKAMCAEELEKFSSEERTDR